MNRIITVNLGGNACQMEDAAYDALRAYLQDAEQRLAQNPDKVEIIADIEAAFADKFAALLGPAKTVIDARDVAAVIAQMGPIEDDSAPAPGSPAGDKAAPGREAKSPEPAHAAGPARRLYRISEGALLKGVCNGFAAFAGLDVALVRLACVLALVPTLLFGWGAAWLLLVAFAAYWVLGVSLPLATTPEQLAAARGAPSTAREFIRRAREGYYEAMKGLGDAESHRDWKRRFRREMRGRRVEARMQARAAREHAWHMQRTHTFAPPFALPILGLLHAAAVIATIVIVFQLITHARILGHPLPPDVPVWLAVVAVVLAAQIVAWPVRVLRHSAYVSCADRTTIVRVGPGFFDTLVWLVAVGFAIWIADRYVPGVHEFIVSLPPRLQSLGDAVQAWWHQSAPPVEKTNPEGTVSAVLSLLGPRA